MRLYFILSIRAMMRTSIIMACLFASTASGQRTVASLNMGWYVPSAPSPPSSGGLPPILQPRMSLFAWTCPRNIWPDGIPRSDGSRRNTAVSTFHVVGVAGPKSRASQRWEHNYIHPIFFVSGAVPWPPTPAWHALRAGSLFLTRDRAAARARTAPTSTKLSPRTTRTASVWGLNR